MFDGVGAQATGNGLSKLHAMIGHVQYGIELGSWWTDRGKRRNLASDPPKRSQNEAPPFLSVSVSSLIASTAGLHSNLLTLGISVRQRDNAVDSAFPIGPAVYTLSMCTATLWQSSVRRGTLCRFRSFILGSCLLLQRASHPRPPQEATNTWTWHILDDRPTTLSPPRSSA